MIKKKVQNGKAVAHLLTPCKTRETISKISKNGRNAHENKRVNHLFELLCVNEPVPVPIKDLEGLPDLGRLVHVRALLLHHLQELVKVDGAVAVEVVLDHQVQDLVLGRVLTDGPEDGEQLLRTDGAAAVLKKV